MQVNDGFGGLEIQHANNIRSLGGGLGERNRKKKRQMKVKDEGNI